MGISLLDQYMFMVLSIFSGSATDIIRFNNHYYEFSSTQANWNQATSRCVDNEGYVVSVNTEDENTLLVDKADENTRYYRIGLRYCSLSGLCPSNWVWTDGSEYLYNDWDSGHPTSSSSRPCAFIRYDTKAWRNQDCNRDFYYICEYEDQCAPNNPCQHGGVCTPVDMWRDYTCNCTGTGYKGRNCEENECGANVICYHGACYSSNDQLYCSCDPGYTGDNCNSDINECQHNSHECQQGVCENTDGTYLCNCNPDYTGTHCETQINDCTSIQCLNEGNCIDGINQYTCNCDLRFQGLNCQDDSDECTIEPNICNSGRCHNNHGGYNCTCSGYSGTNCETDINECESSPAICENGATCVNAPGTYSCNCTGTGYEGYNCTTDIDECQSNPCQNSGTCVDHIASFQCTCSDEFNGTLCENDINECLNETICNVGVCVNTYGSFNCLCPSGFEGETCEGDIDECLKRDINCTNTNGNFTCTCFYPYEGITCGNVSPYNFIFDEPNEPTDMKKRLTKALIVGCVLIFIALIVMFGLLFENKIKAILHRKAPNEQSKTIEEDTEATRI